MNLINSLLKENELLLAFKKKEIVVSMLIEQVHNLEKLQLSPIYDTDTKSTITTSIANCFMKIVNFYYFLLCHNLNTNKLSKNHSYQQGNNCFYYYLIHNFHNMEIVKFIQSFYAEIEQQKKGMIFLCLSLIDRSFYDFLLDLYGMEIIKKYYLNECLLETKRDDILEISKKLSRMHILIKLKQFEELEEFRIKRRGSIDIYDIDIHSIKLNGSKVKITSPHKNTYPIHFNSNAFQGNNMIQSNFVISNDEEMDFLFSKKNEEKEDEYLNFQTPMDEYDLIREKNNVAPNRVYVKGVSSSEDISSQIIQGTQKEYDIKVNENIVFEDNYFDFERDSGKKSIEEKENLYNLNFQFLKRCNKDNYTKNDIMKLKGKVVNITNSVLFYLNHFWKKEEYFHFNTNITNFIGTIENENFQCSLCLARIKYYTLLIGDNVFWCSYFLRYVCGKCFINDYSVIPLFVLANWDFNKYPVSHKAKEIINKYNKNPTIQIKANDNVIRKSSALKHCIVTKRKIHRIFDLIKCNPEEIASNILEGYNYLVLMENVFSLKDLCEIHNGEFEIKLHDFLSQLEKHILSECQTCIYVGNNCYNCNNGEILKAYDVDNVFFCKICGNTYHRRCSIVHLCNIESRC